MISTGSFRLIVVLLFGWSTGLIPSNAHGQSSLLGRPVLFVHGWCGEESTWGPIRADVIKAVVAAQPTLYQDETSYAVYYDPTTSTVRNWPDGSSFPPSGVKTPARFFSINFYDLIPRTPTSSPQINKSLAASISILSKADELAKVIEAITALTQVKDIIVVAHSQGGLVARSYIENLAVPFGGASSCSDADGYSCLTNVSNRRTTYDHNISKLITLDTPHRGVASDLVKLVVSLDLPLACFSENTLNRRELSASSRVIAELTANISSPTAKPTIAAIRTGDYRQIGDGIVTLPEQSIRGVAPGIPDYYDVDNSLSVLAAPSCISLDNPLGVLHMLDCLASNSETRSIIKAEILAALTVPVTPPGPTIGPTWTQKQPTTSPSPRAWHSMAYDVTRGQVVLFGGWNGTEVLNDTWVWDGDSWTQRNPTSSPPKRHYLAAMAYDVAREQVVLFGGSDETGHLTNDTWVWDGANWAQRHPLVSPTARRGHAMAYDADRAELVLFGGDGSDATGSRADTWVWDGTNWTQKRPLNTPPDHSLHAMAYDASRRQVVLYGGQIDGNSRADTWVWDGANWTQKHPANSPRPQLSDAMAYDAAREQIVLVTNPEAGSRVDTWAWDGRDWSRTVSSSSPPARSAHSMVYDAARNQVVLFGGAGTRYYNDTWVWGLGSASLVPTISGGIANAADYRDLSPGALAFMFGDNFAGQAVIGTGSPLPFTLGGVSVSINGRLAPLLYADQHQINFQVPWETTVGTASVMVSVNNVNSNTVAVPMVTAHPGIYFLAGSPWIQDNPAAIQNSDYTLNSPSNPARAGTSIIVYLTGGGPVSPRVSSGAPSPASPLAALTLTYSATLWPVELTPGPTGVAFAGLTPGGVGLVQMNIVVPPSLPTGTYPFYLTVNGQTSNLAKVSVIATASSAAPCAPYPLQFVPFVSVAYVSAPNSVGDRLLVGNMSLTSGGDPGFNSSFEEFQALPLPPIKNLQYCGTVTLATGYSVVAYVPTAAEKLGDFAGFSGLLLDPLAGNVPFPGGIIPFSRFPFMAWRIAPAGAPVPHQ